MTWLKTANSKLTNTLSFQIMMQCFIADIWVLLLWKSWWSKAIFIFLRFVIDKPRGLEFNISILQISKRRYSHWIASIKIKKTIPNSCLTSSIWGILPDINLLIKKVLIMASPRYWIANKDSTILISLLLSKEIV